MKAVRFFIISISVMAIGKIYGMTYDNRFFPLYKPPFSRTCAHQSRVYIAPSFMMAHKSYGDDIEDDIGIYEVFGLYDENNSRVGIMRAGGPDFFATPALENFQGREVPWRMHGKIDTQGFFVCYDQHIYNHWSAGFSAMFMHIFARNNFTLIPRDVTLTSDDVIALDAARRAMDTYLGLDAPVWNQVGLGDLEAYVRFGSVWEYMLKFRRIDIGGRLGLLIPSTALQRTADNPASLALGGDGFWGVYVAGDCELELKEDWLVGALVQLNQRFDHTKTLRLPTAEEQLLYGSVKGSLTIRPAPTLIFSLYAKLEGVRDGLGLRAQYTGVFHGEDGLIDHRPVGSLPFTLQKMRQRSAWQSEYITLDAYYDFNKVWEGYWALPQVNIMVDLPIKFFFAERVTKTNRVSIGIQFLY